VNIAVVAGTERSWQTSEGTPQEFVEDVTARVPAVTVGVNVALLKVVLPNEPVAAPANVYGNHTAVGKTKPAARKAKL
jgi:hypothetical protein